MIEKIELLLLPIIRKAGEIMLSAFDIDGNITKKGNDAANIVTEYDFRVQDFLIKNISSVFPNAFFFAEEKENDKEDLNREYCFVIDPIDGTANFVHEYRKSSISVALFSYGEVIFATVYDPYLDEMFWAKKGSGAFVGNTPINVSKRDMSYALVAFGTSPYYKDMMSEKTFNLAHAFHIHASDIRRAGSAAIDLAYLAAGRNDIFFELVLSPWDFAAGSLLITEAGGIISDFNGDSLDYSKPTSVFAATPKLFDEALKLVKDTLK